MRRRAFISLLGGAAAMPSSLWPLAGRAQQQGKLPLVGVLVSASPPHPFADALRRGLQNLGYSEGRNITLEVRYSGGRSDRAGEIATEFVRLGVDVVVAHFTPAVRAAMGATQTIPIVMAPAGAPLQSGFIDSLARPGGNVTGLSAMDAEIGGRRLQLLGDLIPSLARVAVLASTTATDPFSGPFVENLRLAATRAGRAGGAVCRQNHQGCEPGHSTGRAAHEIPGGVEYKNRPSARPDNITDIACQRRRGDGMKRRAFITVLGGAAAGWPLVMKDIHAAPAH
jgi:hypothetical protein